MDTVTSYPNDQTLISKKPACLLPVVCPAYTATTLTKLVLIVCTNIDSYLSIEGIFISVSRTELPTNKALK